MIAKRLKQCFTATFLAVYLLLMLKSKLASSTNSCPINFDMAVAVDTSSSCSDAEFSRLLSEVKAIVSSFPIGPTKVRLALIEVLQTARVLVNFNDVNSLSDFNSAVDRLRFTSVRAELSKGMKLARESVLSTARKAPTAKLLVLVSDRQCESVPLDTDAELASIKSEADAVRAIGGVVHAVGVGGLYNSQLLGALFNTNYLMFKNKNKALESIKSLNSKICPINCKSLGQSVKKGLCFGVARQVLTDNAVAKQLPSGVNVCRHEIARSFESCAEKNTCNNMDRQLGSCESDGYLSVVETVQFFNRNSQSCVKEEHRQRVDCSRANECDSQVADVMIVLDRSGSLMDEYDKLVDAAKEVVKSLAIGKNNVHVGAVSFSGDFDLKTFIIKNNVITGIELGSVFDKADVLNKIDAMRDHKHHYATFTGEALQKVKAIFESKGRPNVYRAIVIITDGASSDFDDLFAAVSDLKNMGVTFYAVGVTRYRGSFEKELEMLTAPETDKNLVILDDFNKLADWAKKLSSKLCLDLKPINPKLCDANVQLKSISPCHLNRMQTTQVTYQFDANKKCIKHFKNTKMDHCKKFCIDPIDGNGHLEGESWANFCHEFSCNSGGSLALPTKFTKCLAADLSCKSIGSAPFQCRSIEGDLVDNCQCVDRGGEALLVVEIQG